MPPKKGTSTPNKPPENPTSTLYEGEKMHRDINDLQKKIVLHIIFIIPMTVNDVNLSLALRGVSGLSY